MTITQLPPMRPEDTAAIGFATANNVPHLAIDIPDGGYTISAKTSTGAQLTISFMPDHYGGTPVTATIQTHAPGNRPVDHAASPLPIPIIVDL